VVDSNVVVIYIEHHTNRLTTEPMLDNCLMKGYTNGKYTHSYVIERSNKSKVHTFRMILKGSTHIPYVIERSNNGKVHTLHMLLKGETKVDCSFLN
jgi:hypothetical protein